MPSKGQKCSDTRIETLQRNLGLSLEELNALPDEEILKWPNMGKKTLQRLRERGT